MPTIGLVAEGTTDHLILRVLLEAMYGDDVSILPLQPLPQPDGGSPGGWSQVLRYCRDNEFAEAFLVVDFAVVHIDTDVTPLFDEPISHTESGEPVPPGILIERVCDRLIREMNHISDDFYTNHQHRIVFAIAVHSMECWLLPLYYSDNRKSKQTNCLESLNDQLKRDGFSIDPNDKQYRYYLKIFQKQKIKRRKVLEICSNNPGFKRFIVETERLLNSAAPGGLESEGDTSHV